MKAAAGGAVDAACESFTRVQPSSSIQITKSEAKAAFGDATVYLEKFLEKPRHVEVQVLAINTVMQFISSIAIARYNAVIKRCWRKHLLLESTKGTCQVLEACVTACKNMGYVGAGTFEFLYEDGRFYFIEMNTRVQVEHPVSEMVTGIDIIHEQISVAAGNPRQSVTQKSKSTATQLSAVSMQRIQILSCQALD